MVNEDIKALRKFLIQLFGVSLTLITLFILVIGFSLIINSFIVGIILYFIELITDNLVFSVGNVLFGASLLTVIEFLVYKDKKDLQK